MNAVVAPLSKTPSRIDLLLRKVLLDKLDPPGECGINDSGSIG